MCGTRLCLQKTTSIIFYFPVSGRIGVATADKPEGPYSVLDKPVEGIRGIDPVFLLTKTDRLYLYSYGTPLVLPNSKTI